MALISTVKDESLEDMDWFVRSIAAQSRKPDYIVLVDGGSAIVSYFAFSKLVARVLPDTVFLRYPGNRSTGRNRAIWRALSLGADVIASTNLCVLANRWLEKIVEPIEMGGVDVVSGFYYVACKTSREEVAALTTVPKTNVSALNMAFTVGAWFRAGPFPPDLDTSEDTVFVQRLKNAGMRFTFAPEASLLWRPHTLNIKGAWKTFLQFARTDRQAGVLLKKQYGPTYAVYLVSAVLALTPLWPLALVTLGGYLTYRIRRVLRARLFTRIPYAVAMVVSTDMARMAGYTMGSP